MSDHVSTTQDESTPPLSSTELQVPWPAVVVVAPTPQDRALVLSEPAACTCPPTVLAAAGHLPGCPAGG